MKEVERMSTMSGKIADLDVNGRRFTLKSLVMNKTFDVAADATVMTKEKPEAALSDLRPGDPVEVRYEQHEASAIAHAIHQSGVVEHRQAA